jgi:hypothetical protein
MFMGEYVSLGQGQHSRSRGMYFSVLTKVVNFCYWLGACRTIYCRDLHTNVQVNRHSIQLTLIMLLAIIILGKHIALNS